MQVANISQFRKNLKSFIDCVSENQETLIVNGNGKTVVVISLDKYNNMDDTAYLTSTEANKKMMYKAKDEIEKGEIIPKSAKQLANLISDTKSSTKKSAVTSTPRTAGKKPKALA